MGYFDPNSVQDFVSLSYRSAWGTETLVQKDGYLVEIPSSLPEHQLSFQLQYEWGLNSELGRGLVMLSFLDSVRTSSSISASFSDYRQMGQSDAPPQTLSGKQGPRKKGWRHLLLHRRMAGQRYSIPQGAWCQGYQSGLYMYAAWQH